MRCIFHLSAFRPFFGIPYCLMEKHDAIAGKVSSFTLEPASVRCFSPEFRYASATFVHTSQPRGCSRLYLESECRISNGCWNISGSPLVSPSAYGYKGHCSPLRLGPTCTKIVPFGASRGPASPVRGPGGLKLKFQLRHVRFWCTAE